MKRRGRREACIVMVVVVVERGKVLRYAKACLKSVRRKDRGEYSCCSRENQSCLLKRKEEVDEGIRMPNGGGDSAYIQPLCCNWRGDGASTASTTTAGTSDLRSTSDPP
jgi:hypothetical protein